MNDTNSKQNQGITKRSDDYSQWYLDIIEAADLADYGPVKGTMIIKPYGYAIWENVQRELDSQIKATGVQNAYFPLLIPEKFLHKEKQHVEGFSPEVAVVTHAGGKKLNEALVIRPTSETIMYDSFSKWIRSHKDLPLLINQWANVVRWEMRPRLFLRTTEFLWQEGHTAHASEEEADERARMMLGVYERFASDFMAIPCIPGIKSESEKFAGALKTYAVEAMMQDGKALQFGTSHNLGQNFAKAFKIRFQDENGNEDFAWQTSWGVSTRMIGGLIMTHSDDKGLVLPPKIAPIKAVIVPIWKDDGSKEEVLEKATELFNELQTEFNVKLDDRDMRPGEKYYEWEKKGVPVRIEIGLKDIAEKSVVLVRRDSGEKTKAAIKSITKELSSLLDDIQKNLLYKADSMRKKRTVVATDWKEFVSAIEANNFVLAYWNGDAGVEEKIKKETTATIRCIPFDQGESSGTCVYSGKPATIRAIFAKAY